MSRPSTAARPPAIALEQLERHYGDLPRSRGIDLEIARRRVLLADRSQRLRQDDHAADDRRAARPPARPRLRARRGRDTTSRRIKRPVNTVFQHYALFPHLNVFENVAFGLRERKVSRADTTAPGRARCSSWSG